MFHPSEPTHYRYEAFISYRHIEPDYSAAMALHKALEQFRIPAAVRQSSGKQKMGKVFRDQDELPTSPDLGQDIEHALRDSRWLVVVCSPRLPLSRWCMREIETFIELGRRDRILILLIEGTPEESFPEMLRYTEINGERIPREPLAADIRAATPGEMKKKLKVEKLRLLAPMLGVGFDDLRQRTRARIRRNVASASAAAAITLAVFGGAMFYQWAQTKAMETVAASAQTSDLVARSVIYRGDGQQARAVTTAAEALRMANTLGLDPFGAQSALYSSLVNFPGDGPYAKLTHGGPVQVAAFSRDGSRIATLSNYTQVTVWDTKAARQVMAVSLPDSVNFANLFGNDMAERVRLAFTADNRLVVLYIAANDARMVADNIYVALYGHDGALQIEVDTGMFASGSIGFEVWDEAGLIAVSALFDHDEWEMLADGSGTITGDSAPDWRRSSTYTSREGSRAVNSAGLVESGMTGVNVLQMFDIETGEIHYFGKLLAEVFQVQTSNDRSTLAVLSLEGEQADDGPRYYMGTHIFDRSTARTGEPVHSIYGEVDGEANFHYLGDTTFVVQDDKSIYLWDLANYKIAIPGLERPEDTNYAFVDTGSRPGQFFAGYNLHPIWIYQYDGYEAVPVVQVGGFDFLGGGTSNFFAWNEKDRGTVNMLTNNVDNYYERLVTDGSLIYHDYMTTLYEFAPIHMSSGTGLLALAYRNSGVLELYDFSSVPSSFYAKLAPSRHQHDAPYINLTDNRIITHAVIDGSYGFEISHLEGDILVTDGTAVIPGTYGYDSYEDMRAYDAIAYGQERAVVVVENTEDTHSYQVCVLDYSACTLTPIIEIESAYAAPRVLSLSAGSFMLYTDNGEADVTAYDYTGAVVGTLPEQPGASYYNLLGASTTGNKIAWPYKVSGNMATVYFGVADLDKGTYTDFGFASPGSVDAFCWSSDGSRGFLFERSTGVMVIDMIGQKRLPDLSEPGRTVDMRDIGGDLLALLTADGTVELYDMLTCKRLMTSAPLMGDLKSITYNPAAGVVVIATDTESSYYIARTGQRAYGTITYTDRFEPGTTFEAHITGDRSRMVYIVGSTAYTNSANTGLTRYYSYTTYPLYTHAELLAFADEFS